MLRAAASPGGGGGAPGGGGVPPGGGGGAPGGAAELTSSVVLLSVVSGIATGEPAEGGAQQRHYPTEAAQHRPEADGVAGPKP